jgi:hypothetical protein
MRSSFLSGERFFFFEGSPFHLERHRLIALEIEGDIITTNCQTIEIIRIGELDEIRFYLDGWRSGTFRRG